MSERKYKPRPCIVIPSDSRLLDRLVLDQSCELPALQQIVGGNIQLCPLRREALQQLEQRHRIRLGRNAAMYCDEEGRLKGKPHNERATVLFGEFVYGVCGDVFVMDVP